MKQYKKVRRETKGEVKSIYIKADDIKYFGILKEEGINLSDFISHYVRSYCHDLQWKE